MLYFELKNRIFFIIFKVVLFFFIYWVEFIEKEVV